MYGLFPTQEMIHQNYLLSLHLYPAAFIHYVFAYLKYISHVSHTVM